MAPALANQLALIHLATEPVSVADVARVAFGKTFTNEVLPTPARYDMQTRFAPLYGESGPYVENASRELAGIAEFVARERALRG